MGIAPYLVSSDDACILVLVLWVKFVHTLYFPVFYRGWGAGVISHSKISTFLASSSNLCLPYHVLYFVSTWHPKHRQVFLNPAYLKIIIPNEMRFLLRTLKPLCGFGYQFRVLQNYHSSMQSQSLRLSHQQHECKKKNVMYLLVDLQWLYSYSSARLYSWNIVLGFNKYCTFLLLLLQHSLLPQPCQRLWQIYRWACGC